MEGILPEGNNSEEHKCKETLCGHGACVTTVAL